MPNHMSRPCGIILFGQAPLGLDNPFRCGIITFAPKWGNCWRKQNADVNALD